MKLKGLSNVKKTFISLALILVVVGVVVAAGNLLATITPEQAVSQVVITTDVDLNTAASLIGVPFNVAVTVTNPTSIDVGNIHLELKAACGVLVTRADVTGEVATTENACSFTVSSTAKALRPAGDVGGLDARTWALTITYSGLAGPVAWTIEARLGA